MPDQEPQTVVVLAGDLRAPATIVWRDGSIRLVDDAGYVTLALSPEGSPLYSRTGSTRLERSSASAAPTAGTATSTPTS